MAELAIDQLCWVWLEITLKYINTQLLIQSSSKFILYNEYPMRYAESRKTKTQNTSNLGFSTSLVRDVPDIGSLNHRVGLLRTYLQLDAVGNLSSHPHTVHTHTPHQTGKHLSLSLSSLPLSSVVTNSHILSVLLFSSSFFFWSIPPLFLSPSLFSRAFLPFLHLKPDPIWGR